jgi:hypothetical protein
MTLQKIRKFASEHGIYGSKLDKITLVRAIQREEGNFDCFASAHDGHCDQSGCLWREDCLTSSQKNVS